MRQESNKTLVVRLLSVASPIEAIGAGVSRRRQGSAGQGRQHTLRINAQARLNLLVCAHE